MDFSAAIVKANNTPCVVVIVKKDIVQNKFLAEEATQVFSKLFPLMPVILMAQDPRGDGIFWGPPDLVKTLSSTKPEHFPWKQYSVKD